MFYLNHDFPPFFFLLYIYICLILDIIMGSDFCSFLLRTLTILERKGGGLYGLQCARFQCIDVCFCSPFFRLLNWELGKREDSDDSKMCCR